MKIYCCNAKDRHGFTVVEALLALTMSIVLAVIIAAPLPAFSKIAALNISEGKHMRLMQRFLNLLKTDIENAVDFDLSGLAQNRAPFCGLREELQFFTAKGGDIKAVRYYFAGEGLHRETLGFENYLNRLNRETADDPKMSQEEIINGVENLVFEFGCVKENGELQWQETWLNPGFPSVIEIEMTFDNSRKFARTLIMPLGLKLDIK